MKNKFIIGFSVLVAIPSFTFAADAAQPIRSIQDIFAAIITILENSIIPIIVGLAVVTFLIGVLKFIRSAGEEKARSEGKQFMLWGIIGLAVMVSVWGLVGIVTGTLGIEAGLPTVDPSDSI